MLSWAKKNFESARPAGEHRFVALTASASSLFVDRWIERATRTKDGFFWGPGDLARAHDGWTIAGRGAVVRLDACGSDRWTELREQAVRTFSATAEWSEPGVIAPRLRFFGGAAFHSGLADASWAGFGDASFTLPRWLYGVKNDDAFLRFTFRREELSSPEILLAEIARAESESQLPIARPSIGSSSPPANDESVSWRSLVESALAAIHGGAFHKLVVARRSLVSRSISVDASVGKLRRENSESTTFAFMRGASAFLGASPERLIFFEGKRFHTEALAGTIGRAVDDEKAKQALLSSDKDRREHQVVVDGIVSALAPFSKDLEIAEPAVRTLGRVHHLATPIVGHVDHDVHVLTLVAALHPTPAVSGLPQRAASDWIREHESFERGWYAAPVGWFDDRGDGSFAVAIRSALIDENRAWIFAGAGIVDGSEPAAEFAETQLKQKTILAALAPSEQASP